MKKFATLLALLCSAVFTSYSQGYYNLTLNNNSTAVGLTYQDADGLVGIGTATPTSSLTISDVGNTPSILEINRHLNSTTDYSIMVARQFFTGSGPGTSTAMDFAVASTGEVVIGADNSIIPDLPSGTKLAVAGHLVTSGNIFATGQIYTEGTLAITGASYLGSTLWAHGNVSFDGTLSVGGSTSVQGLTVNNAASFNDNVSIDGTLTLNSGIEAKGGIDLRNSGGAGYDPQIRFLSSTGSVRHLITDDVSTGHPGNLLIFPGWYGGGAPNTLEIEGKVGIGTATVTTGSQLTVSGSADLSGSLSAGGSIKGVNTIDVLSNGSSTYDAQFRICDASGTPKHLITNTTGGTMLIYPGFGGGGGAGVLKVEGKVQIGNVPTPSGYGLYVKDGIISEKIKCALSSDAINWSDYVFESNYDLASLSEVEAFIKKHKHLPGVPSAAEVKRDGIDMAQMDATLLKKIEELTLYVLALKKEIATITSQK